MRTRFVNGSNCGNGARTDRPRPTVCLSARLTLPLLPPRQMSSSARPPRPPGPSRHSLKHAPIIIIHIISSRACFALLLLPGEIETVRRPRPSFGPSPMKVWENE